MQVGLIFRLVIRIINDMGLYMRNITIQSDNASGFSSMNLIRFIYNKTSLIRRTIYLLFIDGYALILKQVKASSILIFIYKYKTKILYRR